MIWLYLAFHTNIEIVSENLKLESLVALHAHYSCGDAVFHMLSIHIFMITFLAHSEHVEV